MHRLGSNQWAKAKRKAAEKVRDVAAELLEIHARRAARLVTPINWTMTLTRHSARVSV